MLMNGGIWVGTNERREAVNLLPMMANRHGLISGATGTGKTVTLEVLAEGFSKLGVPVFMADIKGDLAGLSKPGEENGKITERLNACGVSGFRFENCPVAFWDVFGEEGTPVRTTVSEMGPLLLSRMLGLNDTQAGVLHLVFRIADDEGMLLIDIKDLKAMLAYVGDNAQNYVLNYGNITKATIGAIQRAIAILEDQGGDQFFGEPALDIADWFSRDDRGQGMINILSAEKLFRRPALYSTFLLWMLGALYELLPETGDKELPQMVFFFDEAHLLFDDCPKALLEKIEQTVRLIRSKGVGVFFITQNPADVPAAVLSQLAARVQHALRAFTPQELKVVHAVAQTFRANPAFDTEQAIGELKTGEALLSFLMEDGTPSIVQRATILPPQSSIGPISHELRAAFIETSPFTDKYSEPVDRISAYETLSSRFEAQGIKASQVVCPVASQGGQVYAAQTPAAAYAPVHFSVFNQATGQYEQQELPEMPAQPVFQAAPPAAQASQPMTAAAVPVNGQPPVLVWNAAAGQYVPQQAPANRPVKAEKKQPARAAKAEKSYAQQMLDSFTRSTVTSAGREVGRTATRSILGIFGLGGKRR